MIYPLKLETAVVIVGLLLVISHAIALWQPVAVQDWLRKFPRSKAMGIGLLTVAAVWAWLLVREIDLGEFTPWKPRLLVIIPIAYFLTIKFVDEFLAVRALGMVALLAAEPLLEAAFLRPEASRLFLVVLAYVWIVLAMFWIGMPYVLRDQIGWLLRSPARWRAAVWTGLAYGVILLSLRLTLHPPA